MRARSLALALAPSLGLCGCAGAQSAADWAGRHAAITGGLFEMFLGVTGVFFLAVMIFLGWAVARRDRAPRRERALTVTLGLWAACITAGLFALTLGSFLADRRLALANTGGEPPIRLKITAQQWWWEIEYEDPIPANRVRTANILHLPLGRPVEVTLASDDVIHSFWVPNLAGKQDLIPGRATDISLRPTRAGRFRGQCAEFCGLQHAHMALDVIVEPERDFQAWRAHALQPAPPPRTPLQKAGQAIFMRRQCAACHAIAGTPAQGTIGPDLTGVASRMTLAAGRLGNSAPNLAGWIADPQGMKPGNRMPAVPMSADERKAIVAYLETLT